MAGLLAPGPTLAMAEELRKRKGSRGLLEAVGGPMSYAPNPAVAALGQGLLGAQYLTGEKELGSGLASLSDMTAMMVGSRLPPAMRKIFAGVNAKTADKVKLAQAQEMDKAGADNRTIWQKTGWFKGPEGKWKFEIDDKGFDFDRSGDSVGIKGGGGYAEKVLPHKDLYAAYPDVAKTKVALDFPEGDFKGSRGGKYYPEQDYITTTTFQHETPSVALHELQHAVQKREGFARGGTPENAPIPLWDEITAVRTQKSQLGIDPYKIQNKISGGYRVDKDELDRLKAYEALVAREDQLLAKSREIGPYESYRRLAGETESRAVQSRMNMTKQQRGMLFPLDSYDVPLDQLIFR